MRAQRAGGGAAPLPADYALLQRATRMKVIGPPLEEMLRARQNDLDQKSPDFPELPELQAPADAGPLLTQLPLPAPPAWEDSRVAAGQGYAQPADGQGPLVRGSMPVAGAAEGLATSQAAFSQPGPLAREQLYAGTGYGQYRAAAAPEATVSQSGALPREQVYTGTGYGQYNAAAAQEAAFAQPAVLAQEQAYVGTGYSRAAQEAAGMSEAADALQRAASQITQLQAQLVHEQTELTRQQRAAFVAQQRAAQDEQSLKQLKARTGQLQEQLQLEQRKNQESAAQESAIRTQYAKQASEKYEKKLRAEEGLLQASEQRAGAAVASGGKLKAALRRAKEALTQSEARATHLREQLERQAEASKNKEALDSLALRESQAQREEALKALQERSQLLVSNQELLQKGEAQLTQAAAQLQASAKKIASLQSQLVTEKEALVYVESKASEDSKRLRASEALVKEAELRLEVVSQEDAQRLNASEAKLLQREQRLQAMTEKLSAMEAQEASHQSLQARLNSSLAMNRRLQLQLSQEMADVRHKEATLSEMQQSSHTLKVLPLVELQERCEDVCFVLAHNSACCGGGAAAMAERPKSCLTVARIIVGQALAPPSCRDVSGVAEGTSSLQASLLQSAAGSISGSALPAGGEEPSAAQFGAGPALSSTLTAGSGEAVDGGALQALHKPIGSQVDMAALDGAPSGGAADLEDGQAALDAPLPHDSVLDATLQEISDVNSIEKDIAQPKASSASYTSAGLSDGNLAQTARDLSLGLQSLSTQQMQSSSLGYDSSGAPL